MLGDWRIGLVAWRLLVLQTADPAVAAGMAGFSTYRAHPWRRFEHTMDSGKRLFFSDREGLRREVARLATHAPPSGRDRRAGQAVHGVGPGGAGVGAGHLVRVHDDDAGTVRTPAGPV
jgi:hypothetical protein